METKIKTFKEMIRDNGSLPADWQVRGVINDDNMTYIVWNEKTKEAIAVDPMREDWDALSGLATELKGYRWLGVIDTHTHADHISNAAQLAEKVGAPLIQHLSSPSKRIHIRVSRDTQLNAQAAPLRLLVTPGHTADTLTVMWGPFLFGSDTLLYGDTGRDDLPGGDPAAHYESCVKIKALAAPETIFLPGHDGQGRISTWKTQLEVNPMLKMDRETFIREAGSYVGPSPKLLKESLYENFK